MLSKARLQFANVQYVGGPQVDEPVTTTDPIDLVSRWILGWYSPPPGSALRIACWWLGVQPIVHDGGLGVQWQNSHENRLPPGYSEDGGDGASPFCGQSGSEPKEDWWRYKPPLNTCRHRLRKDGQRCGGRQMRGVQCLIVLTGYRAGSIYGNVGGGWIQSICPGAVVSVGSVDRWRERVKSIWQMIRGVRDYRDFASRLGSWGIRSDVFDGDIHLVGIGDRFRYFWPSPAATGLRRSGWMFGLAVRTL